MTATSMASKWRQKTIFKKPRHWFRVPVSAKDKQQSEALLHRSIPPKQLLSPKQQNLPACAADCLIKFFHHGGLIAFRDKFKSLRDCNPSLPECVRKIAKFTHKRLSPKSFDLFHLEDNVLYLFQLSAIHVITGQRDNTHAICVFNSIIYDANMSELLEYNTTNLNACCLGGESWVFHYMSRIYTLTPTDRILRLILKNIRQTEK